MRFKKVNKGWLDNQTGLVWKDKDELDKLTCKEARELNSGAWRLPTAQELLSIVDYTKYRPATKLPNIKPSYYWSVSPNAYNSDYAWGVDFDDGDSYNYHRNFNQYVRLVRDIGENNG